MPNNLYKQLMGSVPTNQNNIFSLIQSIKNPDAFMESMMRTNPQFAKFVNDNKGKSPEQIAREYGIDPSLLNNLFK